MTNEVIERIRANRKPTSEPKKYNCEICKDKTFVITEKDGYTLARPCICRNKVICGMMARSSGLSDLDLQKNFSMFETKNNQALINGLAVAKGYTYKFDSIRYKRPNSVLISGEVGRGKTTLGICITNALLEKGYSVKYAPYRDTIMELKQNITNEFKYKELMDKLKYCPILFLDDLFKGKITESDINIMYEIINQRYLGNLPMIISTEKSIDELLKIDEAVGSRIVEMSKGYWIYFDEFVPNHRLE